MNIAELIKTYCQDHGITYQQFAKDSGTSKAYISMGFKRPEVQILSPRPQKVPKSLRFRDFLIYETMV